MQELKVKEIINQRGISVSQFANMIGVTREHCYSILKGKSVSQKQLQIMSQVLNIPIFALFQSPNINDTSEYNPYDIVFGRQEHYNANDIVTFGKLSGKYGAFSNMSTDYNVECCGHSFKTSEHLFIALRLSGHADIQKEIMEYDNSMWCKKTFVNQQRYKQFHHPNWHDNYFDVEVMKYVVQLKYRQNKGFRDLLSKTKGKIIVEDTTMQNTTNSVLRWGCQDLQKKDIIKDMRSNAKKAINSIKKAEKAKTEALKKPRNKDAQEKRDMKIEARINAMEKMADICEQSVLNSCNYVLVGENAMGKILTVLRDNNGEIDYKLDYPLFLFDNKIS